MKYVIAKVFVACNPCYSGERYKLAKQLKDCIIELQHVCGWGPDYMIHVVFR